MSSQVEIIVPMRWLNNATTQRNKILWTRREWAKNSYITHIYTLCFALCAENVWECMCAIFFSRCYHLLLISDPLKILKRSRSVVMGFCNNKKPPSEFNKKISFNDTQINSFITQLVAIWISFFTTIKFVFFWNFLTEKATDWEFLTNIGKRKKTSISFVALEKANQVLNMALLNY